MSESAQTTVEKEQAESPLLFQREGVPSLKNLLPCSLQPVSYTHLTLPTITRV